MSKQFTVPIILPADPAAPMEAATKQYVDGKVSGGPETEVYIGAADPIATAPLTELWVDTDAYGAGGETGTPLGAMVGGTLGTTVPSGAWTKVPLGGTVNWADASVFTVNAGDLVCQQAGRYIVTASLMITLAHTTTQRLGVDIYVNGALATPRIHTGTTTPLSQFVMPVTTTGALTLAVNDRLSMMCYHQTGADRVTADPTWLSAERIGGIKGDKGDVGSGSTVIVQEEGTQVANRPAINFVGDRLTASDDAANNRTNVSITQGLLFYYGGWTSVRTWQNRDVAQRFGALWVWESATADPASSTGPGTNVTGWRLLGGTPNMTNAEIAAWTTMVAGCSVFNRDTNRLNVWDDAQWRPSYPFSYGGQFVMTTVAAGTNDATVRNIYTSAALAYGGLLTVNGRVDVTLAGTGTTEMRVEGYLFRGGSSIGTIAASAARITVATAGSYSIPFNWQWYDARPADEVQVTIKRQSGTMTYGCTITTSNWHGIQIIEQPN